MVRTRETATIRVVGAKAPRKAAAFPSTSQSSDESSGKKYSGGNSYCPRETPAWQKNITCFFGSSSSNKDKDEESLSKSSSDDSSVKTVSETSTSSKSAAASSSIDDVNDKENVAESSSS
ncbi:unnamed protein product [Bemisia tabaci]|uniref:PCNA-associated factor n=1 Tax=Bemisia tabaci TaxID=7038 RepID=A0A9P0AHT8_BEMTA|nr:unnamed protein product [Bemisia tabaci]